MYFKNVSFRKWHKKRASYSHRTAQPFILAVFLPWGVSKGAGRIRLARRKGNFSLLITKYFYELCKCFLQ